MIKWLAILLLIVNVVVFLGRDQQPEKDSPAEAGPPALNLQHMMLSKEVKVPSNAAEVNQNNVAQPEVIQDEELAMAREVQPAGMVFKINDLTKPELSESKQALDEADQVQQASGKQSESAGAEKPMEQSKAPDQVASQAPSTPEPKPVVEALQCYRAGPYTSSKTVSKLLAALESLSIVYKKDEEKVATEASSGVRAARVYLGPFATDAALAKQKSILKTKKVDAFALKRPGGRVIQLGYFKKQGEALKNAHSMQRVMKAKGLDAKVEVERDAASTRTTIQFKAKESQMVKGKITDMAGSGNLNKTSCQ